MTPPPGGPKVTPLVTETQVTGVPEKVFVLITAEFLPSVSTGRHTHPGDEYGAVVEGAIVTQQTGGEWKTVTAGQSILCPRRHRARNQERRGQAGKDVQRLRHRERKAAGNAGPLTTGAAWNAPRARLITIKPGEPLARLLGLMPACWRAATSAPV